MATQLLKTVKPSGGDYTSLEACMNANEQNLITADKYFDVEIDGNWSSAEDTTPVIIHNYDTDATRYINIYTTAAARHAGEWDDTKYTLVRTTSGEHQNTITDSAQSTRITGLQIKLVKGGEWQSGYAYAQSFGAKSSYHTLDRNLIYVITNTYTGYTLVGLGFYCSTSSEIKVQNCGFYSDDNGANMSRAVRIDDSAGSATGYFYNNTFVGWTVGMYRGSEDVTHYVKNCGFYNVTTKFTGSWSETTNSTTTPTFASGKTFHLASGDTTWKDQGTDLSSDSGRINTLDIDGESRSGSWDIGADEYVAAAAGQPTIKRWGGVPGMAINRGVW